MNFKQTIHEPEEMANTIAELIFIPAPGIGHMMSSIEIARLLVSRNQQLSIIVFIIKQLSTSASASAVTTYIESLSKKPMDRISFIELPQGKTPTIRLSEFINSCCKYVRNVVADMMSQRGFGRVAGFIVDMSLTGMMDVANEFNVPAYVFFTSNAAFLGFQLYIQTLCDYRNQDVVELNKSDAMIPVPSFIKPVPTKVFPTIVKSRERLDFFLQSARKLREAKAIMVNTFLELETHAIKSLFSDKSIPSVYPVGPILKLEAGAGKPLNNDAISWLDSQPPSSVVFLCFGSMGFFDEVQVKEIAHALERSGHRFLWSLRQRASPEQKSRAPRDYEDPGVVLPEGFLERTVGIGKVIGWTPQVELLAHHAVGGFVSHCGWNSLLESLWFGVPSATWPIYSEQQINAFEMVVELGLAVEIKLDYKKADRVIVTAQEIESGIRRLMEDNEVRTKVEEMSKKSRAAVTEGGSSFASVGRLIQDFIGNIS